MLYVRKVVSSKDGDVAVIVWMLLRSRLYFTRTSMLQVTSHVHIRVVLPTLSMHARFVRTPKGGKSRTERKYHSTRLADKIEITVRSISYRVSKE